MEDEREGVKVSLTPVEMRVTSTITARRTKPGKVSADTWEKIMRALYVYRLGGMDFLELLATWEDILGITHPPTTDQL